ACNTVIFDEAHALPETASLFFGESVSTSQLVELARDVRIEGAAGAKDNTALPEAAARLEKAAKDLRLEIRDDTGRQTHAQVMARRDFAEALEGAIAALSELSTVLEAQGDRTVGLQNCWTRSLDLLDRLDRWQEAADN